MGKGIALLFHDHGIRRGWVVSSTPRPYFTPGKNPVPIVQEAGWTPGPVWTGEENLVPYRDSIPRPSVAIPTELPGPQLLVIQFNIKIFHIGFMQVLAIVVEISKFKNLKLLKLSYLQ
jgi:hypothetical protein